MGTLNNSTEEHIKKVARDIFFAEGRLNATTQDIANVANVNRTLINYYFRSRDALFDVVFKESMENFRKNIESIIIQETSIRNRLENLIDFLLKETIQYPFREIFFITQINQSNNEKVKPPHKPEQKNWKSFLKKIQSEIDAGHIQTTNAVDYMLNIFSMCIFPVLMTPVYSNMFNMKEEDYQQLLNVRKKNILIFLDTTIQTDKQI
jgi:TetR/AcrR family transcriptional regulator